VTSIAEPVARSEASTARRERLRVLLRSPSFLVGTVVLLFWVVCAILGDRITPYHPLFDQTPDLSVPPSTEHWFGTDRLGRDVFSRVLAGSRDILLVAPLATLLATIFGTILGLVTGYFRGIADDTLSRVIDAVLAIPLIVLAVTVVAPPADTFLAAGWTTTSLVVLKARPSAATSSGTSTARGGRPWTWSSGSSAPVTRWRGWWRPAPPTTPCSRGCCRTRARCRLWWR